MVSEAAPTSAAVVVVSGAGGVSMSVATGVAGADRSGADSVIVVVSPLGLSPVGAIDAAWLALKDRRGCNATVAAGAEVQPSSPPVAAGVVVSVE